MINGKKFLLCFLLFVCLIFSANAVLDDSIGYYSYDSDLVSDSSDYPNTLINNGGTSGTGKVNNGLELSGSGQYQTGSDIYSNTNGSSNHFTISVWVNPNTLSTQSQIISKANPSFNREYFFGFSSTTGKPWFYYYNFASAKNVVANNPINTGVWTHLVARYDGSYMSIYINGIEDNKIAASGGLTKGNSPLYIGSFDGTTQLFNGKIDELAIYNRSLSNSEIEDLYNSGDGFNPYAGVPTGDLSFINITLNDIDFANHSYFNTSNITLSTFLEVTNDNKNVNVTYKVNGYTPFDNQFITNSLNGSINFNKSTGIGLNKIVRFEPSVNGIPEINGYKIGYGGIYSSADEAALAFCNMVLDSDRALTSASSTTNESAYFWNGTNFVFESNVEFLSYIRFTDCEIFANDGTWVLDIFAFNNETSVNYTGNHFHIDTTPANLNFNNNTEFNDYTFNISELNISCEDDNLRYCAIYWDDGNITNSTTGNFNENKTFSTNGNHTFTIDVWDLAGNHFNETGQLFINPNFYVYFYNDTGIVNNFTINDTLYENYFSGTIYEYGLNNFTFIFSKSGYKDFNFQLQFNKTSDINKTYNTAIPYIRIFIRNLNNGSLTNQTNFTILYNDGTNSYSEDVINNNTLLVRNAYESNVELTINLVFNETITTNRVIVTPREDINISFYMPQSKEELYTKYFEVLTAGLVVIPNNKVYLYVNLKDTNEYVLLQQKTTNSLGIVSFEVVANDYVYTICSVYNNVEKCLRQQIFDTVETDYQIIHDSTLDSTVRNVLDYITWSYYDNKTTTTSKISYSYEDRQSNVDSFCLNVSRYTGNTKEHIELLCSENIAGYLTQTYSLVENQYLEYSFLYKIEEDYFFLNKIKSYYVSQVNLNLQNTGLLDYIFLIVFLGAIGVVLGFKNFDIYSISILAILLIISIVQAVFSEQYINLIIWGISLINKAIFYYVRAD